MLYEMSHEENIDNNVLLGHSVHPGDVFKKMSVGPSLVCKQILIDGVRHNPDGIVTGM